MLQQDIAVLRPLTYRYYAASQHPRNAENARLYRAVNGLRPIRRRFNEIHESKITQMEELGLYELEPLTIHCTPALCDELPGEGFDPSGPVLRKHIWGRGSAQLFSSVGKMMHDEFDIDYAIETFKGFGLVYYGCCEPLDRKMDIVERIPNLRKIGVTPWADADVAAEAIGTKYVFSSKPNPASVAVPHLNEDELRKELGHILAAVKRNNCACDITLKDISSAGYNLKNLIRWEQIAMEAVQSL